MAVDPLIGRDLNGRYKVADIIGRGNMGTVYRGTQNAVGREVAIKVVSARLTHDQTAVKRFMREAQLASKLTHPNAVTVLDFGQTDDELIYLVMELVEGRTLEEVVAAEGKLSAPRIVKIGSQICDALQASHALKIIHRDLKPANIMLSAGDVVKVLDFGLAKSLESNNVAMTSVGAILGTPAVMPPESVSGGIVDGRADLYSVGCTLYFAAMGKMPFESVSITEMIVMHVTEPPPPLVGVQVALSRVIERLLAKSPGDRYADAAAARAALEATVTGGRAIVKRDVSRPPVAPASPAVKAKAKEFATMLGWATPPAGIPITKPRTEPVPVARPTNESPVAIKIKTAESAPSARLTPTPMPAPSPSPPQTARPTPSTPQPRPTPSPPQSRPTPSTPSTPQPHPTPSPPQSRPTPSTPQPRPTPSPPQSRPTPSTPQVRPTPAPLVPAKPTPSPPTPSSPTPAPLVASTPTPSTPGVVPTQLTTPREARNVKIAWTIIALVFLASAGLVVYTLLTRA